MLFSSPRKTFSRSLRSRLLPQIWRVDIATHKLSNHGDRHYYHHHQVRDGRVVAPPAAALPTEPSIRVQHVQHARHSTLVPQRDTQKTEQDHTSSSSSSSSSSLAILPLNTVLRSLAITTCTSVPALLGPALSSLSVLAHAKSDLLNPDKNVLLKSVLRQTIYSQFCAGETPTEVRKTMADLKQLGYAGVILGYAREVVMDDDEASMMGAQAAEAGDADRTSAEQGLREIDKWKKGTMQTVELAQKGDFVALKFTGAGRQALQHLVHGLPPSPDLEKAIIEICDQARDRKILLLFDAEQHAVQDTIDAWVLDLQRKYNGSFSMKGKPRALIYNTYQAYLQSTPKTLATHLAIAQRESFVLGVKLVRGAYLNSDPRHLFWSTKPETDNSYNTIARCLMTRQYNDFLKREETSSSSFPQANLVLAGHNRASVTKARALRDEQARRGEPMIEMVYGQLQGMADDISCELVHQSRTAAAKHTSSGQSGEIPKPYKYLVWGTVGECTKYLLRRGHENRDAASRTKDTRAAMFQELKRRSLRG
jgi:proline dehydrogenase